MSAMRDMPSRHTVIKSYLLCLVRKKKEKAKEKIAAKHNPEKLPLLSKSSIYRGKKKNATYTYIFQSTYLFTYFVANLL